MKVQPVGTITLPVVVGAYSQQIAKEVNFLVVDCLSSYNAIIGWPISNSWKVVTSIYHLSVKFPTEYDIGQVQGDQLATRECYLAMLAMDEHVQTMNIKQSPLKYWKKSLWKKVILKSLPELEQVWRKRRSKTLSTS